jgi:hypothetical protein
MISERERLLGHHRHSFALSFMTDLANHFLHNKGSIDEVLRFTKDRRNKVIVDFVAVDRLYFPIMVCDVHFVLVVCNIQRSFQEPSALSCLLNEGISQIAHELTGASSSSSSSLPGRTPLSVSARSNNIIETMTVEMSFYDSLTSSTDGAYYFSLLQKWLPIAVRHQLRDGSTT